MNTVLFIDIDSTLIENEFSPHLFSQIVDEMAADTGRTRQDIQRAIYRDNERRQRETPNDPATMDWEDIVNTVAQQLGSRKQWPFSQMWQQMAKANDIRVLDNALEVIQKLKQPHRQLVIATKGLSIYQLPVLDAVGLTPLFDDILTPDKTGYLKTQPNYFKAYTQQNNTRFIQVGDHYYDDVICAKRNGFQVILRAPILEVSRMDAFERPALIERYSSEISTFPKDGTDVYPDAIVMSLEEIPEVVAHMERANANSQH